MTAESEWQVSDDAAEVYEQFFVPAIFGPWAERMAAAAQIGSTDRVLDVACGTGVLARTAANRTETRSQVTGLDRNEGMLAVARRIRPQMDWRQGDAAALPFADGSFDVVVSQFALMYFADRVTALREMNRVLKPRGRLAIAVWGPFERAESYVILTDIAQRRCGQSAADVLTSPFALGDKDDVIDLFMSANIKDVRVELHAGTMTFPSIRAFVETEVKGSPLEPLFDDSSYSAMLAEAEDRLQPYRTNGGQVVMPLDAYIITSEKA